mmetsp:Transcript_4139/g.17421  ORF Transcript_4139/g.17421 Transcript_4139/m.17421 type:complete len:272 (-) Transcript_4139:69-884(-)
METTGASGRASTATSSATSAQSCAVATSDCSTVFRRRTQGEGAHASGSSTRITRTCRGSSLATSPSSATAVSASVGLENSTTTRVGVSPAGSMRQRVIVPKPPNISRMSSSAKTPTPPVTSTAELVRSGSGAGGAPAEVAGPADGWAADADTDVWASAAAPMEAVTTPEDCDTGTPAVMGTGAAEAGVDAAGVTAAAAGTTAGADAAGCGAAGASGRKCSGTPGRADAMRCTVKGKMAPAGQSGPALSGTPWAMSSRMCWAAWGMVTLSSP